MDSKYAKKINKTLHEICIKTIRYIFSDLDFPMHWSIIIKAVHRTQLLQIYLQWIAVTQQVNMVHVYEYKHIYFVGKLIRYYLLIQQCGCGRYPPESCSPHTDMWRSTQHVDLLE